MSLTNKNVTLSGVKTNDYVITLDNSYNNSFKIKIRDYKTDFLFNQAWDSIKEGTKVSVTVNPGDNTLVSVIQIKAKINTRINKPEGFDNGYWIDQKTSKIFGAAKNRLDNNGYFHIQLTGGAGYGKTSLAQYFAQQYNYPLTIVDCATITDNIEWFGSSSASNGNTYFEETEFVESLLKGHCTILFDEANRIDTWISNTLLPILDHRKQVRVKNKLYKAGLGIGFFFSTNMGYEYSGTWSLDKALMNRISGIINVGALPNDVEKYLLHSKYPKVETKTIVLIVEILNRVRTYDNFNTNVSTRTGINIVEWIQDGLSIQDAFDLVLINGANSEEKKIIVDTVNDTLMRYSDDN